MHWDDGESLIVGGNCDARSIERDDTQRRVERTEIIFRDERQLPRPRRRVGYGTTKDRHGDRPLHATPHPVAGPCMPAGSVGRQCASRAAAGGPVISQSARVHSGRRSTWVEASCSMHIDVSGPATRPASAVYLSEHRRRCTTLRGACLLFDPVIECCRGLSVCVPHAEWRLYSQPVRSAAASKQC